MEFWTWFFISLVLVGSLYLMEHVPSSDNLFKKVFRWAILVMFVILFFHAIGFSLPNFRIPQIGQVTEEKHK